MLSDEARFGQWPVFEDYRVVQGRLVPIGRVVRRYNALDERLYPALLESLGTRDGILGFVRRFGLSAARPSEDARGHGEGSEDNHRRGYEIEEWEIVYRSASQLSQYVGLVRKGRHFKTGEPMLPELSSSVSGAWQFGIELFINRALQPHYGLALDADAKGNWRLRHLPYGLIGLIWKQLIDLLLENRRFVPCENCGTLFDVKPRSGTEGHRRNRRFCSNEKKRNAKLLRAGGRSLQAIARELDVDLQTVQRWTDAQRKGQ